MSLFILELSLPVVPPNMVQTVFLLYVSTGRDLVPMSYNLTVVLFTFAENFSNKPFTPLMLE